jgi:putative transposase
MPRQPRYFVPNLPQHVVARGVDRQAVFFRDQDYTLYHQCLMRAARVSHCQVHAYVLMTNHVHLLVTPEEQSSLPVLMQSVGRNYVQRINSQYKRTGTLWEGRYKASPVQSDRYLLACYRYIELNPVRAAMVMSPGDYHFSSYGGNAWGTLDPLLSPHPVFLGLHSDPEGRRRAYRSLFQDTLSEDLLSVFRNKTNACAVIGSDLFRDEIAKRGRTRSG